MSRVRGLAEWRPRARTLALLDQAVRLPDQAAAAHREAARLIEETIHTPPF